METGAEVAAMMAGDTTAQFFGWYERHLQRMKYSGMYGLAVHYDQYRDLIAAELNREVPDRLLELDPDFELPEYYTSIDIHQHPGGVWSDEIAGYVYERGAQSTAPMLKKAATLWHRLHDEAMSRAGDGVKRVVDLGCGFGASTQPFYADHPRHRCHRRRVVRALPAARRTAGGRSAGAKRPVPSGRRVRDRAGGRR